MNYPLRLAVDWLVIIATLTAANYLGPWSWWPALVVIGSRQQALGEIGHMAMHHGRHWLCRFAFLPIGVEPRKYQAFHLAHHRSVGDPVFDPEVAVQRRFAERWVKPRRRDLVLDLLGLHIDEAIVTVGRIATPASMLPQVVVVAWLAWLWPIVLLWPVAVGTGLLFVHRMRSWTEHRHLTEPGMTIRKPRPALWQRLLYLPHGTWMHWRHHNPGRDPGSCELA